LASSGGRPPGGARPAAAPGGHGGAEEERPAPAPGVGTRWTRRAWAHAVAVSLLPWALARVVVLIGLATARYEIRYFHITNTRALTVSGSGLLGWDASWYLAIAAHGYGGVARSGLRFFPLLPLLTRGLHYLTRLPLGACLLAIVNVASLLAAAGLYLLARDELGDEGTARRSVWLLSLLPPAFVLVMGYSESLFLVLAIVCFHNLRRSDWLWAALAGFLAGTARPIGCLLVVPALVEVLRRRHGAGNRAVAARAGQVLAVVAPLAGVAAYLGWVQSTFGGFLRPLTIQQQAQYHGSPGAPLSAPYHSLADLLHGSHLAAASHILWFALAMCMLAVSFRRMAASYALFSAAVLVAALAGSNLGSFERYALSAFPLVVAGATLLESPRLLAATLVLSAMLLLGYSELSFLGLYVP